MDGFLCVLQNQLFYLLFFSTWSAACPKLLLRDIARAPCLRLHVSCALSLALCHGFLRVSFSENLTQAGPWRALKPCVIICFFEYIYIKPKSPSSQAFGSESTEVRKAVVTVFVALYGLLRSAFAPFAETYLNVQQQKLVQIYIDKSGAA